MTPKPQSIADAPDCPKTCAECEECQFSYYYSCWHCGNDGDIGDGMTLDNDIHMTVHPNCPLKQRDD